MFPEPEAPIPIAVNEFVQVMLLAPEAIKLTDVDRLLQID